MLAEMLQDLRECPAEAQEKEYRIPGPVAMQTAERMLRYCYDFSQRYYAVYPMPNGQIVIHASNRDTLFLLECFEDESIEAWIARRGNFMQHNRYLHAYDALRRVVYGTLKEIEPD